MSISINRTVLLGNIGRDPEYRKFPNGDRFASFYVCTTERWKDRITGDWREHSEWNKVQVRDIYLIENLERFAQKGTRVYVEGVLRTRRVPSTSGGEDRWFTEVDASRVSLEGHLREKCEHDPMQAPQESPQPQQPQQREKPPAEQSARGSRAVSRRKNPGNSSHQPRIQQEPSGFETDDALKGSKPSF